MAMAIVSVIVFAALVWLWVGFAERDRIHRLDAETFRRHMAELPWKAKGNPNG